MLETLARSGPEPRTERAQQSVIAGILHELSGNRKSAERMWRDVEEKQPAASCVFYPQLARALRTGGPDGLEEMRYHPQTKSEMLFFAGHLYRSRDNGKRARALFELCVKTDPTRALPAFYAKKYLD